MAEVAVGAVGQNADTYVVSMNMNFNKKKHVDMKKKSYICSIVTRK